MAHQRPGGLRKEPPHGSDVLVSNGVRSHSERPLLSRSVRTIETNLGVRPVRRGSDRDLGLPRRTHRFMDELLYWWTQSRSVLASDTHCMLRTYFNQEIMVPSHSRQLHGGWATAADRLRSCRQVWRHVNQTISPRAGRPRCVEAASSCWTLHRRKRQARKHAAVCTTISAQSKMLHPEPFSQSGKRIDARQDTRPAEDHEGSSVDGPVLAEDSPKSLSRRATRQRSTGQRAHIHPCPGAMAVEGDCHFARG